MNKKSAFLVIICLFLGAVFTQISAQRTYQGKTTSTFWIDVYCDGVLTDQVKGEMRTHWVFHSGQGTWQILQIKGSASSESGEEFKYIENDRKDLFLDPWVVKLHYNLKGNQGNHYIGTAWGDLTDLICCNKIVFTPIHTKCK